VTFVFVLATLGIFSVTFALLLALTTTAVPPRLKFFHVWLLPRGSIGGLCLLWLGWSIEQARPAQPDRGPCLRDATVDLRNNHPLLLIILANGFIGASLGMLIFTSAIRSIPEHLFHAARVDGAGALAIVRHITLPALRWPISYMTIHQTLSLLVSFEYILLITGGGPFYDTTVFSLYAYRRAFENGQYAYGAALSLILIVIGVVAALGMWRSWTCGGSCDPADRGPLMAAAACSTTGTAARTDWPALARRAWRRRFSGQSMLLGFLVVVSAPIVLPYFWMLVIAFTARTGGVGSDVLWTACAVIAPAVLIYSIVHLTVAAKRLRLLAGLILFGIAGALLVALIGGRLHLDNFRFLWRADFVEELRSKATSGAQFPSVWNAFFNSLALALRW
jgi:ABC-type sugar transport system permease subunit